MTESESAPPDIGFAVGHDLATVLEIEELDRDLYRGTNTADAHRRPRLYGGQVAAQALRAAGNTVPADRHPHSLHGYFLRPGRADRRVILRVERDRDGRSFSARRVAAIQDGEVIFSASVSFHVAEPGGSYDEERPDVVAPDGLPLRVVDPLLEVREVTRSVYDGYPVAISNRLWVRVVHPLPDDPLVHACALTYVSDLGSGFGQIDVPGLAKGGPSIDHAMWFHEPLRLDDWVLIDLLPWKANGGRGVYLGSIRDRAGTLGATLAQEILLRMPRRPQD